MGSRRKIGKGGVATPVFARCPAGCLARNYLSNSHGARCDAAANEQQAEQTEGMRGGQTEGDRDRQWEGERGTYDGRDLGGNREAPRWQVRHSHSLSLFLPHFGNQSPSH